jgi:hypothetical protein
MKPQLILCVLFWLTVVVAMLQCVATGQAPTQSNTDGQDARLTFAIGKQIPVLKFAKERDLYIGRVVAITGVIEDRSKVQYLMGVRVKCPDELIGKEVCAVGILKRFEVKEVDRRSANDGPGIKYTLYSDLVGEVAEVHEVVR